MTSLHLCLVSMLCLSAGHTQQTDILIAEFEDADYGNWKATGTAFGSGPAHGTLPGQMEVTGFKGKGLVNSFHGGDASTGTLTSPEFRIERKYIKFLIGGGGWAGKTCMNLVVDGKIVRTATGPNTEPGGSERLEPSGWDVAEFAGKPAQLVIVDSATGGWGHINVDHIVLSDTPADVPMPRERNFTLEKRYLHFPVTNATRPGKLQRVSVIVDGNVVREFEIELVDQPDWFARLDVSAWRGKKATVRVDKLPKSAGSLDLITQADAIGGTDRLYQEPLRAQLRFSPRRGWNNDPNGLVYADGEYHLYFQHNPYGCPWGNMHWGHAMSRDLVHWEELPIALYPRRFGDWAFSGGAIVDKHNTSGWKTGENALIVATYTSTGRGECVVYSNDRGRTFQEFPGNPIIKHAGRDPRPFWYEPGKHWVVAVYDEFEKGRYIAFYTSPDLKTWTFQSRIAGFFECPDLFELPLGDKRLWVLTAANSDYMVGTFDGKTVTPQTGMCKGHQGRGFYASQTFSNEPKGRVVQIGWLQTSTPGMPFNQAMSLPLELGLRATADGPRLTWQPVKELESLRVRSHRLGAITMKEGDSNPLTKAGGELIELRAEIEPGTAAQIAFTVRGVPIVYDVKKQELIVNDHRAAAPLQSGKQRLIVYADRSVFEVFASDGLTYVPLPVNPKAENTSIAVGVRGGAAQFRQLDVYKLKSAWNK